MRTCPLTAMVAGSRAVDDVVDVAPAARRSHLGGIARDRYHRPIASDPTMLFNPSRECYRTGTKTLPANRRRFLNAAPCGGSVPTDVATPHLIQEVLR